MQAPRVGAGAAWRCCRVLWGREGEGKFFLVDFPEHLAVGEDGWEERRKGDREKDSRLERYKAVKAKQRKIYKGVMLSTKHMRMQDRRKGEGRKKNGRAKGKEN